MAPHTLLAWKDSQLSVSGLDDTGIARVPVMVGLRLFLPETGPDDPA